MSKYEQIIKCANCPSVYNHIVRVEVLQTTKKDNEAKLIEIHKDCFIISENHIDTFWQHTEDAVRIHFECEDCLCEWTRTIHHHKGCCFIDDVKQKVIIRIYGDT